MIIKINGAILERSISFDHFDMKPFLPKSNKETKKMKKLAIWLWSVSGTFLFKSQALAAGTSSSMWVQMQPLWQTFQDIALVLGGISLFIGLITFMFKRSLGKTVVMSSILVVGGCFLVPSALMLIAIIGSMLNEILVDVFQNMNLENSVNVSR